MIVRWRQVGRRTIWLGAGEGWSTLVASEMGQGIVLLLIISVSSAQEDPAGAALGVAGALCSLHQAIKGVNQGADLAQHPTWKGHCVAQQWHGWFQEGQVWNHCSAFILCVVFPDTEDVAGKYLCFCMLGDWGLSLHLSPRPLCLPAASESRKAGNSGPWCAQLAYCPLATY